MLEKTLESPLDCKEIQPVHPTGSQSWIFIGRSDAEDETPILWPPDVKNWLIWKDPEAGKDWRQEEKGMTEDKMIGWHHQSWWTGRPGVLQSMELQRVGQDWVTELNWRGFPCGLVVKNPPVNAGHTGSIPGLGRSSGEGNGYPLQYSCLAYPMDRGAWWTIVHGFTKSQTWLNDWAQRD